MTLSSQHRSFLQEVRAAALMSPFNDERFAIDARLANLAPDDARVLPALVARLATVLDEIPAMDELVAEEQELVRYGALFEAFHRHAEAFDALIERQRGKPEPVAFPEHAEVLATLCARGVSTEGSLALFYQLRRAFRFLVEALPGTDAPMRQLRRRLWEQLFGQDTFRYHRYLEGRMQDFSVLLLGATGTGKTTAAGCLGRAGMIPWKGTHFAASYERLFVATNLSELPGSLLESALFGHRKGAFTGAIAARKGLLAMANPHGVVFLDEIAELDTPAQIKLLRVLQERVFTPLGADTSERFEGRVIAATHRTPEALLAAGTMRDDFYFRLCSDVVQLPSLRARLDDDASCLRRLVHVIVERIVGEPCLALGDELSELIEADTHPSYPWPGNVRELEQRVRRTLLSGSVPAPSASPAATQPEFWQRAQKGELELREMVEGYVRHVHGGHSSLEQSARQLGVDRRTVRKHLHKHDQKGQD